MRPCAYAGPPPLPARVGVRAPVAQLDRASVFGTGEPPAQPRGKQATCDSPAEPLCQRLCQFAAEVAPTAPDLAALLTAWPNLPEALKAGIVAMARATAGNKEVGR
jgi:hypothetical protein